MQQPASQKDISGTIFGRLLEQKRRKAGMSLADLALLTRLPLATLENLESGAAAAPGFDVCYRIGQAINSRAQQGFVVQDLWEASAIDKLTQNARATSARLSWSPQDQFAARAA
ncbi:MAG: helix-turn-helix domain-containing protein [Blastocatellia bacterium]